MPRPPYTSTPPIKCLPKDRPGFPLLNQLLMKKGDLNTSIDPAIQPSKYKSLGHNQLRAKKF